jgi:hypothetical protein
MAHRRGLPHRHVDDILPRLERPLATPTHPYPPDLDGSLTASPDGKRLYYGASQSSSNIWLVRRAAPPSP